MSQKLESAIAVIGIDIGKNSFHVVGHDARGAGAVPSSSGKSPARSVSRACDGQVENGSWQIRKSPHDCRLDQTVCCSFIDETGHETFADKNYPVFGLGGWASLQAQR